MNNSKFNQAALEDHGILADNELDAVTGGAKASNDDLILAAVLAAAAAHMLPRG